MYQPWLVLLQILQNPFWQCFPSESLRVKISSCFQHLHTFYHLFQLSNFTSLMYLDNVPFCHILLRTNEALLNLIFGLSGCLDFLVSAFTFVITSLGNFSFPPQPISWVTIAWRLPPSAGFCSFQAPFPHPRDLKFSKHNGKFYLALIRSMKKAVNAPCYQTHFLSFFIFLLFTIAVLRTCYISFEEWINTLNN